MLQVTQGDRQRCQFVEIA